MFDDIKYKTNCPVCSSVVSSFQSKDGDCFLDLLSPLEVLNFYSSCHNCGAWIEFNRVVDPCRFNMTVEIDDKIDPKYNKTVTIE